MFSIRSKLLSLLLPWLQSEPDLEVKLGFLSSHGTAKDLRFDVSALNQLFDSSSLLVFKEARVEHITVRISSWSAPAFAIEVHGFYVTFGVREITGERCRQQKQNSFDGTARGKKEILSVIDPEGTALHDVIDKISRIKSARNWLETSLLNVLLKHCRLLIDDIHFKVQLPITGDPLAWSWKMKEFSVNALHHKHTCLLRGLLGGILMPQKVCSLALNASGLEIGLQREEHFNPVLSPVELFTCIKLKNLQILDVDVHASEFNVVVSPVDLPILLAFNMLSCQGERHARSGRELWNVAASRIGYMTSNPMLSWHKLVDVLRLWLHHVHAYESLLSLVGYPSEKAFEKSSSKMSLNRTFSTHVKGQWKVISKLEKDLPVEALARARQIARCRAAMHVQHRENSSELQFDGCRKLFCKILSLFASLIQILCFIFQSVIAFFFAGEILDRDLKDDGTLRVVSEDSRSQYCFSFKKVSFTVSPVSTVPSPIAAKSESPIDTSHLNFSSFCVAVDTFFLVFTIGNITQSFFISCGDLKVTSSTAMIFPPVGRSLRKETRHSFKVQGRDMKKIVWGEPAPKVFHLEKLVTESVSTTRNACFFDMESYLEELWSNWKKNHKKFETSRTPYLETSFLLCEIKSSLMVPCLHSPNHGLWKCSLSLGKLNVDLDYSSLLSISLLLRQVEHALYMVASYGATRAVSQSPSIIEEPKEVKWGDFQKLYESRIKMAMFGLIPEKKLQIGVAIAGAKIRISIQDDGFLGAMEQDANQIVTQGHGDLCIAFGLENIGLAVWPTSKRSSIPFTAEPGEDNVETELHASNTLRLSRISGEIRNKKYMSQGCITLDSCLQIRGLTAYLEDLEGNQQNPIIGLTSISIQSLLCREYIHSLMTTDTALSASLYTVAAGVAVFSYMDELLVFPQVVERILSAISCASTSVDPASCFHFKEIIRKYEGYGDQDPDGFIQASREGANLILKSTQFAINVSFELNSLDIILHSSRESHIVKNCMKPYGLSSGKKVTAVDVPEHGIAVAVKKLRAQMSWEEGYIKTSMGFSGIQSVMFKCLSQIGERIDEHELSNLLLRCPSFLYEFSISNCTLTLWTTSDEDALSSATVNTAEGSGRSKESNSMEGHKKTGPFHSMTSNLPASLSYQFLINIALGEIFMATRSLKKIMIGGHQQKELLSSLSTVGEFHAVTWTIQGGLIFLETAALAMFLRCFSAHLLWITNIVSTLPLWEPISSGRQSGAVQRGQEMAGPINRPSKECAVGTTSSLPVLETDNPSESKWPLLEALLLKLSQFSLVLVVADGSDGVWELVLEADFDLNIELSNLNRKLFDLHRLTIFSHRLPSGCSEHTKDIQILGFSSVVVKELSSHSLFRDPTLQFQPIESVPPVNYGECSSSSPVSQESMVDNDLSKHSHFNHGNCILKHVAASILVEKAAARNGVDRFWLNNDWAGRGSVSGFDLTISLSDIQMLFSLIAPLSGDMSGTAANVKATGNLKQRQLSRSEEEDKVLEDIIPDGAIVAIQDIHQHMYLAVQDVENKYEMTGAIHYSLVGKKALFRVRYCTRKKWGLPALCFSLISLHAKSGSGEPLRLNYRSGSGFVDISGIGDSGGSLWKTIDYKGERYEADSDLDSYNPSSKNILYLVNNKCNCAVAFIDGVPEFVQKPGNPFKVKLFNDFPLMHSVKPDTSSGGTYDPSVHDRTLVPEEETSEQASDLPYINITIDKVSLTIVHDLLDANDNFPLLQACINNIQLIVQVLSSKARLISTFTSAIFYFDAQGNLWREIVCPVEMCMFYHSSFEFQRTELAPKGVPTHFYFRTKQVHISLTELSLDILLFMVGKLDLAGPFSVKSSMIFANCCKVENRSSLSLLCHFYDSQDATIGGKQAASIFLRHGALAKHLPENSSFLSVQLAAPGTFTTAPIHVSLLNPQVFAWRTRFISSQDSRTYPGPFVVVDVTKKAEEGLSVVVTPLLRIHNETEFPIELRFRRPQQKEAESVSIMLGTGDTLDDSKTAVDALNLFGETKKTLMSLSLGNFLFSFRPEVTEYFGICRRPTSTEWSEDFKGGKPIRLSGIFDKLGYGFRRALGVETMKYSFSTVHCSLNVEGACITDLHFLIQTIGRDVPLTPPENVRDTSDTRTAPVALQEQKEIFLLPTVQVFNHLQSEIHVLLSETHPDLTPTEGCNNIGKQATISCGSSAYLYVNPAMIYFTVTLTAFDSRCKPVNSGDWVKKLQKKQRDVHYLDIDLDFGGGKYFSSLRLSRGDRGILEAAVFTSYALENDSDLSIFCFAANQKALSRKEAEKYGSNLPPELGSFLPPKSTRSWFLKSNKVNLSLLEERASAALLDLDALSGFTEVCFEIHGGGGVVHLSKLGVSLRPCQTKMAVPSQTVLLEPRYVISNETHEIIFVRQCNMEDDMDGIISVGSKQKTTLRMKTVVNNRREINFIDSLLRKHSIANLDCSIFIQFRLNDIEWSWSGPVCIASLGRFFLKFRRPLDSLGNQSNLIAGQENKMTEYAVVNVVQEGSTLILHFHRPRNIVLPYRIENFLNNASITYYQKDSLDSESLRSGSSVNYVWDDVNLPHQLVVQIAEMHLSREINMDKVRAWKPFFKVRQQRGLALDLPLNKKPKEQRRMKDESLDVETLKMGYEVYADGPTRVLRLSEFPGRCKEEAWFNPCAKVQLRVPHFALHLLENRNQDEDANEPSIYSPVVVARLENINLDSMFTDKSKFNQIRIQSLDVDEKWVGAPFAAMLRRHRSDNSDANENILQIVFILLSANSGVQQVKYSSIVLQPLDLNLDEETLMRLAPFWRTSLSTSTQSRQFYFEHFEIHPIKIVASFLPGSADSNYSSAQETLRSFMHSVIKIPAVKSKNVELNGILVTHALVTVRELFIKCAQHYSWYGMRAVYIAKGSPLLPPAFASIFDDSASSSLDVFFDPSSGLVNLPGLTLGMFKFVSKCINKKGSSGTKRYFGDLGKTVKTAGSNVLFAALTEISDCVLKGAEANGFNGMVNGFHQGILKLAMEPSLLGTAFLEGGPDRKIKLDRSPGVDELYIEGYLQAMLDTMYKQEYLRIRVADNQVILKNLPPNSSLMNEIIDHVKSFLISKALLRGESSANSLPLRHLQGENEWKIGPTVLTLWEHLFVSFAIRMLRRQAIKVVTNVKWKGKSLGEVGKAIIPSPPTNENQGMKLNLKWGIRKFIFSGVIAYIDGRLCRCIPNAIVRRIVSGFLLTLLDSKTNNE